jgi:plastocyanin
LRSLRSGPWPGSALERERSQMKKGSFRQIPLASFYVAALLALAGCATGQSGKSVVSVPKGQEAVAMEASDFNFQPSEIQLTKKGTFKLNVKNTSSATHNITIKNPRGEVIRSVDIPVGETVPVTVDLPEVGVYEFYCDKPLHATMGMKGRIVVASGTS